MLNRLLRNSLILHLARLDILNVLTGLSVDNLSTGVGVLGINQLLALDLSLSHSLHLDVSDDANDGNCNSDAASDRD